MRAARALVFPSLWYEGQPLTVMEAKAMGTPVVVSDGCAGREEIEDGVAGLWFANGDADALASALTRLGDDLLAARLSRGAHQSFGRSRRRWSGMSRPSSSVYQARSLHAAAPADTA